MNKILILLLNRFLKLQGINTNTHLNRLKMAISCNPLAKTYQNETNRIILEHIILLYLYTFV